MSIIKYGEFSPIQDRFVQLVGGDKVKFKKEVGFALQALNNSNQLQKAAKDSIMSAVLNVAQTGLTLNPIHQQAYLVPRFTGGQVKCALEPSYQGLVKLITDTGSVKNVVAYPVFKGDLFDYELGLERKLKHIPKHKSKEVEYSYAIAVLADGTQQIEVMHISDIEAIKEMSESYKAFKAGKIKSCVWTSHEGEMSRKTVLKRLCKYLPKSERHEQLNQAIAFDNSDYDLPASHEKYVFIDSLLETSSISEENKEEIHNQLNGELTTNQANSIINYLNENQLNPIESGNNYSQSDIHKQLDQKAA